METITYTELRTAVRLIHDLDGGALLLPTARELLALYADHADAMRRDAFGLNPVVTALRTALIAKNDIGLRRDGILAALLAPLACRGCGAPPYAGDVPPSAPLACRGCGASPHAGAVPPSAQPCPAPLTTSGRPPLAHDISPAVDTILRGLARVQELYVKTPAIESENFRGLLLSFADDMRVVLIMIADRVAVMRAIRDTPNTEARTRVAQEAAYLYAPLAHKLGLYSLKSELEDLALKYLEHDAYYHIKDKLAATKAARDAYIDAFIRPVSERLDAAGLHYHIKGRTKSIHSIWQKMKKQQCPFEGVYDLFAIRIIIATDTAHEKQACWQAYSLITDMYQPNPRRLRDWLSVPKSNGYESLHITVLGPDQRWVEVQIRTERMDDIAEHGLAAHWRYKGVGAAAGGMDQWLAAIRAALEAGDDMQTMDSLRLGLYEDEVFVFTPKGEIRKLPKGATVLDFAYHIHTRIGNQCIGAVVGGRHVQMRYVLQSGDTVQIETSASQKPRAGWLDIVKTAHARSKIRQAIKEALTRDGVYAREMLERRFKNRKIDVEESQLQQLIHRMGYKQVADFYTALATGALDPLTVVERYQTMAAGDVPPSARAGALPPSARPHTAVAPAEGARQQSVGARTVVPAAGNARPVADTLIIDRSLSGVDYTLARCCRPIYGDPVFAFVTASGGMKIHRTDCPNATALRERFGYRILDAKWSGKGDNTYDTTLRVTGNDDIGIVNNMTSIISKEPGITLRGINLDSDDGLFRGIVRLGTGDGAHLNALIKKLKAISGVKLVERL